MTSSAFQLLKLPSIPLEIVLNLLEPFQVIELTMISRSMDNVISQTYGLKQKTFELKLCYSQNDSKAGISLVFEERDAYINWKVAVPIRKVFFQFENVFTKNPILSHLINFNGFDGLREKTPSWINSKWLINGRKWPVKRDRRTFILANEPSETKSVIEDLTKHLLRILNVENFSFSTNKTDSMVYRELFFLKYTRKFRLVRISNQFLLPEELDFLLNEIQTKRIEFGGIYGRPINWEVRPYPPVWPPKNRAVLNLQHEYMSFDRFEWIDFTSVLNMKSTIINIRKAEGGITSTNIIDLINAWTGGKMGKCSLSATFHFENSEIRVRFQEEILNGITQNDNITIEKVEEEEDKREDYYIITRLDDGKKADLSEMKFTPTTLFLSVSFS